MTTQLHIRRCQYFGSTEKLGLLGNRLQYLICRSCGAVLYQRVAEPHRFLPCKVAHKDKT